MKLQELKERLAAANIDSASYCLEGGLPNEAFCIEATNDGNWQTYYSERGQRTDLRTFNSEREACEYLWTCLSGS